MWRISCRLSDWGFALIDCSKAFNQSERCIRKPTDLQNSISQRGGVIAGIDLSRGHMQLAEPNG